MPAPQNPFASLILENPSVSHHKGNFAHGLNVVQRISRSPRQLFDLSIYSNRRTTKGRSVMAQYSRILSTSRREPGDHIAGISVWRKDWIEHVFYLSVTDHKRQTLQQRHPTRLESWQAQSAREA